MTTIPTALLIIAAISLPLLGAVLAVILAAGPDSYYPVEKYGKTGLTIRERVKIFVLFWLAPTAAMLAVWMIF